MNSHKSAFLGLALGALVLGVTACEDKATTVVVPDPAVEIGITPASLTLQVGQTGQFSASVTGGNTSTDRTVTYSSSNPSVATVSASGAVTAVAAGTSTITATNAASGLSASAQVIVTAGPTPPPPAEQPTISIKSITFGNTLTPVNINNVFGQVDITLNVDIPAGNNIQRLEVLVGNTVACSQTFTSGTVGAGLGVEAANASVEIVCSVNTAAFNSTTGAVTYPNGTYQVSARLVGAGGSIAASTTTTLVFNNANFYTLSYTTSGGTAQNSVATIAPAGSQWTSGSVTVTGRSINFRTANDAAASVTVALTSSGTGVNGLAGCTVTGVLATDPTIPASFGGAGGATTPNCAVATTTQVVNVTNGAFTATFPTSASMAAGGVSNVEEIFTFGVPASVTVGGQAGATCVNPDPARNPIAGGACATAGTALFANPLRLDNLAPRFTSIAMPPANVNNYFNGSVTFSHTAQSGASNVAGRVRTVDMGVDDQTATFLAGAPGAATAATSTNDLNESVTNNAYVFGATTTDDLGNSRTSYATATHTTVNTSSTAGSTFRFGIDKTLPTFTVTPTADIINGAPAGAWTFTFTDAGIGPSGFGPTPVNISLQRVLASGSTCLVGGTGCAKVATAGAAQPYDNGTGVAGYYQLQANASDAAGNTTADQTELGLLDVTFPVVAPIGGPSAINGNSSVTFTSSMQDDVELGTIVPFVGYTLTPAGGAPAGFNGYVAGPTVTVGTMGIDAIVNTSAGNATFPNFITSVETTDGAGAPSGNITIASTINYNVRDVAAVQTSQACPAPGAAAPLANTQNCAQRSDQIRTNVLAGTPGTPQSFTASAPAGLATWQQGAVSNGGTLDRSSNPTVTLTATATGPAATFAQPWTRVEFWYLSADGLWKQISGTVSTSATDNTITNIRTWTYTISFGPFSTNAENGARQVMAVGVASNGRALLTNQQTVTVQD